MYAHFDKMYAHFDKMYAHLNKMYAHFDKMYAQIINLLQRSETSSRKLVRYEFVLVMYHKSFFENENLKYFLRYATLLSSLSPLATFQRPWLEMLEEYEYISYDIL
jgi:hypothetical protein